MTDDKKNGGTQVAEKKPLSWEWETPHGVVKLGVDTVRRYFCPDATEPEVMHFLAVCKYHKINPWLKEAYLIKYGQSDPATIVVGKDFYNRRAQEFPTYRGHAAGIILQVKGTDGKLSIERRVGAFHTAEEKLLGGWAKVFRGDREDSIEIEVEVGEYIQTRKDGTVTRFWKDKPATMIRKVALSQAWRESFPGEFAGTLDEAEVAGKEPMTIDMPKSNAEAETAASPADAPAAPPDNGGTEPGDEEALEKEARAREQAEAQPTKVESIRQQAWRLVQEKAAEKKIRPTQLLYQLSHKQNMTDLTDVEVQGLLALL